MKILSLMLPMMFLLSACTKSETLGPNEKLNLAHEIMSHHASDTTIEIESGTEKLFENKNGWYYVCGRAMVNQPGLSRHLVQRFIINVNPDKHGIARYEATKDDQEFLDWWSVRCDGYVLPVATTVILAPPVTPVTIDEWRQSLGTAYEQAQVEKTNEGVTRFMAMFPKKGGVVAFGEHDAFNKAYTFKPSSTKLDWDLGPNLRSYVLLTEGSSPIMILSPLFWGRDGYISLRKLAILVDGELLFEKTFQAVDVIRGRYGVGVNESANILLFGDALLPFRKITKESKVAIRLTGERGYVNLKKDGVDPIAGFTSSIIDSLFIYDSINKATAGHHLPVQP